MMGSLDILYFGRFRDALGCERERVDPPSHVATLGDLIEWLKGRGEAYAATFADPAGVRGAVEGVRADAEDSVFGAREVALFPPGGVL